MKKPLRVTELHALYPGCLLLTFSTGETCVVNLKTFFGEQAYGQVFASDDSFRDMKIDWSGGMIWGNGYFLSGANLRIIAMRQRNAWQQSSETTKE